MTWTVSSLPQKHRESNSKPNQLKFQTKFEPKKTVFTPLTSILTLKTAKLCKSDPTSEFLKLKIFFDGIFSQIGEKKFQTKFDPEKSIFWPLTSILTLKMAKLWKSDLTSEFLDLKRFPGEIFSQIGEKNFRSKFDPKWVQCTRKG